MADSVVQELLEKVQALEARIAELERREPDGFVPYGTTAPTDSPPNGAMRIVYSGGVHYVYYRQNGVWTYWAAASNVGGTGEGYAIFNTIKIVCTSTEAYLALKYTAQENIARGEVVCFDQSNTQKVKRVPTAGNELDMPIGVATEAISAGSAGWIAVAGLVYVMPIATVTAAVGYVLYCSTTTAGWVEQAANVGAAQHWREVGHWYENGSGAGALARAQIHFN